MDPVRDLENLKRVYIDKDLICTPLHYSLPCSSEFFQLTTWILVWAELNTRNIRGEIGLVLPLGSSRKLLELKRMLFVLLLSNYLYNFSMDLWLFHGVISIPGSVKQHEIDGLWRLQRKKMGDLEIRCHCKRRRRSLSPHASALWFASEIQRTQSLNLIFLAPESLFSLYYKRISVFLAALLVFQTSENGVEKTPRPISYSEKNKVLVLTVFTWVSSVSNISSNWVSRLWRINEIFLGYRWFSSQIDIFHAMHDLNLNLDDINSCQWSLLLLVMRRYKVGSSSYLPPKPAFSLSNKYTRLAKQRANALAKKFAVARFFLG